MGIRYSWGEIVQTVSLITTQTHLLTISWILILNTDPYNKTLPQIEPRNSYKKKVKRKKIYRVSF